MFRQLILVLVLLVAAGLAQAAEAGRIVFVVGEAKIGARPAVLGNAVQEGDDVSTGAEGYLYLKTIDSGFLILRPQSRARIVAYHVDLQDKSKTHIKLELLSGVARHISGQAVKEARENFRFNTPVAAIGVRGTDFTVFTDQETSRVAVIAGGIVVSGFSATCGPEGRGPCEGSASRELFAHQTGQLLQISRGQAVPQLMRGNGLSPDVTAPPRSDEPVAKVVAPSPVAGPASSGNASFSGNELTLDPQKNAALQQLSAAAPPVVTPPVVTPPVVTPPVVTPPVVTPPVVTPPVVTPPVVEPPVVVVPPVVEPPVIPPVANPPQITWGRWKAFLDQGINLDVTKLSETNQILAINAYYILMRSKGSDWQVPSSGTMGFALKQGEANILNETSRQTTAATIENGKLQVNFAKSSFSTSFDLVSLNERFKMQAQGDISRDGQLFGASQFAKTTNMDVSGVLTPENGGSAAYLFQSRIDAQRVATGATYWGK